MLRTVESLGNLEGKTVLVRCDLNVPLQDGVITDDGRIRAALPTIKSLGEKGAAVLVAAHLGRPGGKADPQYSLKPVAARMGELLGQDITLAADVTGESAKQIAEELRPGEIAFLENVRFDARETSQDAAQRQALAKEYAELADAFVSDGYGVVHRKQASVYDVAEMLPAAAGGLVITEMEALSKVTDDPERPYVVILGGSKVSDKLGVIENLLQKADAVLIGGGMAYTFLKALGYEVGTSLLEEDQIETVRSYIQEAKDRGVDLVLPVDVVVAPEFSKDAPFEVFDADDMPPKGMGLDIGPKSQELFSEYIRNAKTVAWNGPMGVFEFPSFAGGTRAIAQALTESAAYSVVGGGDSAAAIRLLGFDEEKFSHISTGGGASLELLEGKTLPGIAVLED